MWRYVNNHGRKPVAGRPAAAKTLKGRHNSFIFNREFSYRRQKYPSQMYYAPPELGISRVELPRAVARGYSYRDPAGLIALKPFRKEKQSFYSIRDTVKAKKRMKDTLSFLF